MFRCIDLIVELMHFVPLYINELFVDNVVNVATAQVFIEQLDIYVEVKFG